jgi:hypothetical protein
MTGASTHRWLTVTATAPDPRAIGRHVLLPDANAAIQHGRAALSACLRCGDSVARAVAWLPAATTPAAALAALHDWRTYGRWAGRVSVFYGLCGTCVATLDATIAHVEATWPLFVAPVTRSELVCLTGAKETP